MRVVVCSGRYHLLFIVASACPFVIYVCFMARRIRKHLIKDGRVVGVREATEPGRGGEGRRYRPAEKGTHGLHTSPRNSLVFRPPVLQLRSRFYVQLRRFPHRRVSPAFFVFGVADVLLPGTFM